METDDRGGSTLVSRLTVRDVIRCVCFKSTVEISLCSCVWGLPHPWGHRRRLPQWRGTSWWPRCRWADVRRAWRWGPAAGPADPADTHRSSEPWRSARRLGDMRHLVKTAGWLPLRLVRQLSGMCMCVCVHEVWAWAGFYQRNCRGCSWNHSGLRLQGGWRSRSGWIICLFGLEFILPENKQLVELNWDFVASELSSFMAIN